MKNSNLAYVQLTLAMFLAGSTVVAGKYIMGIPIFLSQAISLVFSMIVLFPMAHCKEGAIKHFKVTRKDKILLFSQAVTGLFLFRIFILVGLRYTSAIASGVVMSTTPIILTVFGVIFLKEKLNRCRGVGIVLGVAGMMLVNTPSVSLRVTGAVAPILGNAFILLAVMGEVLFTILRKKQSFENKPITTSAFIMLAAFLLFLPLALYQLKDFNLVSLGIVEGVALLYYGIFASALAYSCWFSGIAKVSVSTAAGFAGVMPISSVLLSVLLLKEKMVWQYVAGLVLIIISIYMIIAIETKKKCENLISITGRAI